MDEQINGRIPPHNMEAEQSVLGSMLLDKTAASIAVERLIPESFYSQQHREIFEAMLALFGRGVPLDMVTVYDELEKRGTTETAGGIAYLAELAQGIPTTANAEEYVRIVDDRYTLRRLIEAGGEIMADGYAGEQETLDILSAAEKSIFDISLRNSAASLRLANSAVQEAYERIEDMYTNKNKLTGIASGFEDMDRMLSGLNKANLILLAARPAMGKSSLAMNIADHVATELKLPVAVFNLEMSRVELCSRLICSRARVDSQLARRGELGTEEWERLAMALKQYARSPLYIDDTPGITPMQVLSKCRRLKIERGLSLVVVDYLQLMAADNSKKTGNRQEEVSNISRSLKLIAKELDVPVIALSQLSRAVENRPDHRPQLSDLRESGSIEQDADTVMFLYRDEVYNPESEKKGMAELIISKQRSGPLGTVELDWMAPYTRFRSHPREYTGQPPKGV
ncbi:MAG: replicative DNA helicase [Eubacteriales bacterium]|nr:replicative DNA helicase [Eubacteriales bacterium]